VDGEANMLHGDELIFLITYQKKSPYPRHLPQADDNPPIPNDKRNAVSILLSKPYNFLRI
jgi:hypothetical protein